MTDANERRSLPAELKRLEATIVAEKAAERRLAKTSLAVAAAISAIVVGFLAVNFVRLRREFTSEKLSKSLEKELSEFAPTALRELSILGRDLLPAYVEAWDKQFRAAWPEISAKLDQELVRLGKNLKTRVHEALLGIEERSLEGVRRAVSKHYPSLSDPSRQAEIAERLHAYCDQALEQSLLDFDRMFSKDVSRLQDAILTFDVKDGEESTVDLQKKFLRLWLQLLDQEIMRI
ncbi:MAG: hypothetical protein ACUVYA_05165 [Planctomycetota bacterium]